MNFHHRKIDSRPPPEKLPQNFASECSLNVMFKHLILLLFFFAPVPGLFASITEVDSPDGHFSVEYFQTDDSLKILDSKGRPIFNFKETDGHRAVGAYWSPNSQRVIVVIQWKWYADIDAAQYQDGEWKDVPVSDYSKELNQKAQVYLGIKITGGPWTDYGSYFDNLKWLSDDKFEYVESQDYGNGKGPKDASSDFKTLHYAATMEFGSDSIRTVDITVTAAKASNSDDQSSVPSVQRPRTVENDPRYAPVDGRLNEVYSALRSRLSPSKREQLRQMEREFLSRRERLRNNPDGFFAFTEQQISTLQQMLDAL
jgi:hypothetical protein